MRSSLHLPALRRSTALRFAVVGVLIVAASAFPSLPALGQQGPIYCTDASVCPPNELCCPSAGYYGAPKICTVPVHGHCPYYP